MSNITNLNDLYVDSIHIAGVAVSTAVLLASGQAVDLNGEAGGLILDAAAVVVLEGATAGHAHLVVSGTTVLDALATGVVVTGTESVSGILTATGGVKNGLFAAVSASGAISIVNADKTFYITKSASGAAMTLVNPTATTHDGLIYRFISTTAQAHTLDNSAGAGFNNAGAGGDVATFGGAIGDNIVITAYQGKWYIISSVNITLG